MPQKIHYIYTLSCPTTGYVKYVGRSYNPLTRIIGHCSTTKPTTVSSWVDSLKEQSLIPQMDIIDEATDSNKNDLEIYWIQQFKSWGFDLLNRNGKASKSQSSIPKPGTKRQSKETQELVDRLLALKGRLPKYYPDYIPLYENAFGEQSINQKKRIRAVWNFRGTCGTIISNLESIYSPYTK